MDRRDRIVAAARAHSGCSAHRDVDRYLDVIVREADRDDAAKRPYYLADSELSTCALFAVGVLRLCGCEQPECVAPYVGAGGRGVLRDAFVDLQALARRYDAWTSGGLPAAPLQRGDVFVIVRDDGTDGHMGVCVSDAAASAGGWVVETVEGGQLDERSGSTAIGGPFTRHFAARANRRYLGDRYLLGYASADRLPVPDTQEADAANA